MENPDRPFPPPPETQRPQTIPRQHGAAAAGRCRTRLNKHKQRARQAEREERGMRPDRQSESWFTKQQAVREKMDGKKRLRQVFHRNPTKAHTISVGQNTMLLITMRASVVPNPPTKPQGRSSSSSTSRSSSFVRRPIDWRTVDIAHKRRKVARVLDLGLCRGGFILIRKRRRGEKRLNGAAR